MVGVLALSAVSCSSASDADRPVASTTTPGPTSTPTPVPALPEGCDPPDHCPLQVAGREAGLVIGTALKFGPEREAIEEVEFSGVTAEIQFLWSVIHPERDRYDFGGADQVVDYAQEHDKVLTATHFVWDPPGIKSVLPDWVRAITDPDELRAVLRDHFTTIHRRYAGKVDRWAVVNEPLAADGTLDEDNVFLRVLGPGYVAEAFRLAAEVWPETELVLNENLTEYLPRKAEALVEMVEGLLAEGVRVDRVGLQSHLFFGPPNLELARRTMERLGALGVAVDITELDVPLRSITGTAPIDLEAQGERGAGIVRACLAVPECESVTFWGFDDGDTWLDDFMGPGNRPLLYDEGLEPKPLYRSVLAALLEGRPEG
ncbi:MAG: beta,4-xylanase [Acidimicrobiales bacterium]|nr:beta,4-xylanase [Acidimicrobiales bacterium]